MHRRLTTRVISLSIFWIVLTLLVTAFLLTWLYRDHIEQHYDAHVFTHVEELMAAVESGPDGSFSLYRQPTDPRFHRLNSGWYWQILAGDRVLAKSGSLGENLLDVSGLNFEENHNMQEILGPNGQTLRAQVVHMSHERIPEAITILATAPEIQIRDDVQDFLWHIMISFLLLALGLSIAVVVQVTVALRPLKAIKTAISDVHAGKFDRLPRDFPADVQPVVDELNSLIDHNETLLKRARTQLADLAHAVKTPLTVIRNEARELESKQGQLILDQAHVMSGNIDHYLSRARISGQKGALGSRTSIKAVTEDLRFAVERMFKGRDISVELCSKGDCRFSGEVQDLEEMLGNLVENACKWARRTVEIRCRLDGDRLTLTVEDDGPGIAREDFENVLQRGHKLDETIPGHGQGLGIVKDIAELYGGSIRLGKSPLGGLKAELELPAAT
jgi:signal transduction histidine kinase